MCVFTDPPDVSMYSKDDVVLGAENTLICHVTGLFPPPVNVSWTKNNQIVTEGMSLSQYRINNDGTFNIFSALKITPAEEDIYSCTVFHKALASRFETKTWGEALLHVSIFSGCKVFINPYCFQILCFRPPDLLPLTTQKQFRVNITIGRHDSFNTI